MATSERRGRQKPPCPEQQQVPGLTTRQPHVFVCIRDAGHKGDHRMELRTEPVK